MGKLFFSVSISLDGFIAPEERAGAPEIGVPAEKCKQFIASEPLSATMAGL
ncbi:MAG: hypothetical protein ABSG85_10195 [Spirochaetia bacterium]|jgi:hypothetical protein